MKSMRYRWLVLLLCAACAREIRSTDPANWMELQSEHFVVSTDLPEADARQAANDLELIRTALMTAGWKSSRPQLRKFHVVALASDREAREFLPANVDGAQFSTESENVLVVAGDGNLLRSQVVKHELTHALLDELLVTNPRWVQEGIACYLETLRIDRKGEAIRGEPEFDRRSALSRRKPVNWSSDVMGVGAAFWNIDGYLYETAAWALVHWLVDNWPERFDSFLNHLARGDSMWVAFNTEFPDLTEARVAAGMREFMRDMNDLPRTRVVVQQWSGSVSTRRMGVAEVHALRAQLLGRAARKKNAESAKPDLQLALQADPGNVLALTLSSESSARPAVELHPEDWRSWVLWYDRNPSDASALRKAAEMAPDQPEVLRRLALLEVDEKHLEAALKSAERAVVLSPGRAKVLATLAIVQSVSGRCEEGRSTWDRAFDALPEGIDKSTLADLRRLLEESAATCRQAAEGATPARSIEYEPVLKSCRQAIYLPRSAYDLTARFTIREDGTVTAVSVEGNASNELIGVLRQFVESCTFEPVVIGGKSRRLQAVIPFRSLVN
jgi:hypothetical protein